MVELLSVIFSARVLQIAFYVEIKGIFEPPAAAHRFESLVVQRLRRGLLRDAVPFFFLFHFVPPLIYLIGASKHSLETVSGGRRLENSLDLNIKSDLQDPGRKK